MSENRARYPIAVMCRVLDVSASGYFGDWKVVKEFVARRASRDGRACVERADALQHTARTSPVSRSMITVHHAQRSPGK